nr:SIR2 family protein [Bradyrhizobium sp. 199]
MLFGSGSSMPSNAPSVQDLQRHFESKFGISASQYNLAEQTSIIEVSTRDRKTLIAELRTKFKGLEPTGALLNLPLLPWKCIFTTNYDTLIEDSYKRRSASCAVYSCNFDFGVDRDPDAIQIFKIHGTIDKDVADGNKSRIILTEGDYDQTADFREQLWDRLRADIAGNHLIVIGHSLADPDIKSVVDRALGLIQKSGGGGRVTLFSFTRDDGRALLFESRGISVCFGGIDDFFAGLTTLIVRPPVAAPATGDPLDEQAGLRPTTIDIAHQVATAAPKVSAMFNGWPASYADIEAGYTFKRNVVIAIEGQFFKSDKHIAVVLGPAGTGKTTAARQLATNLLRAKVFCWEHKREQPLLSEAWRKVAQFLKSNGLVGCLIIDEAHLDLSDVNKLSDYLASDANVSLKLVLISSVNHWHPRVKVPSLHKAAQEYNLNRVQSNEIDRLLDLAEQIKDIRDLVERGFAGFSRPERRRRLTERCEADMFVCLKNIFSSDNFDDIILREYATLNPTLQDVYKSVAAMEWAGVHVHRQLIIRLLGIGASYVSNVVTDLADIIHEETVDERQGIFAWRGRHLVIMGIIAQQKYYLENSRFELFKRVVAAISPTYEIEIRTIRELCNVETGLATLTDKREQNIILRMMISTAPRERVPRHRLMRNLIALGEYDQADTEMRLFQKDFRSADGPTTRYKIDLAVARAIRSPGLMDEDRIVLLEKAREAAAAAAERFAVNKAVLTAYCEVGLATMKLTRRPDVFYAAIAQLKDAEDQTEDTDISRRVARLEARMRSLGSGVDVDVGPTELEFED